MRNLTALLLVLTSSFAFATGRPVDGDFLRSTDHLKIWTPPAATDTLVGRASTDTLTNKTLSGNTATNLISGSGTLTLPTSGTVTVPNGTDTLVSLTGSQTLTNKTLSGNTAVTLISGSGTLTLPTTGSVIVPNGADTLVNLTGTQTLTNKTLTGNTAVNLKSGTGTLTLNTTGTVTVPNATDTLVGKATTDTLTNKTLSGNTAVTLISGSGTLTLNTTGTVTLPNATDTLVGKATTDTMTNKTLTSPSITGAALDFAQFTDQSVPATPAAGKHRLYFDTTTGKLASVNSAGAISLVGSGSGGINHITNGDAESGTTGWFAYKDSQTVTISNASPAVITTPAGIASLLYVGMPIVFSTTGGLPTGLTSGTTYYVSAILSSTTINISAIPGGVNINTSSAGSGTHTLSPLVLMRGTTTAAVGVTWATSATAPLRGSNSFTFTKTAARDEGNGVSYDFTLDTADLKVSQQLSFDYAVSSGTFVNGTSTTDSDVKIFVFDVTNGKIVSTSSQKILGQSGTFNVTFSPTTATAYRLAIHVSSVSASAYTLKFDNFQQGPFAFSVADVSTSWQAYTPTVSGMTLSAGHLMWRRDGADLLLKGSIDTSAVAASPGQIYFPLPSMATATSSSVISDVACNVVTNTDLNVTFVTQAVSSSGTNYVTLSRRYGGNSDDPTSSATNMNSIVGTGSYTLDCRIPMAGWTSLSAISTDTANTDWADAGAATITATTTAPTKGSATIVADHFWWKKDNGNMLYRYEYTQTAQGTATSGSGDYLFAVPSSIGCTIDTTKITVSTTTGPSVQSGSGIMGSGYAVVPGTATSPISAAAYSTTQFRLITGSTYIGNANYQLGQATVSYSVSGSVPCLNWPNAQNAPQLVGAITSDALGVLKIVGISLVTSTGGGPCTLTSSTSSSVGVGGSNAGQCSVSFGGLYNQVPYCTMTPEDINAAVVADYVNGGFPTTAGFVVNTFSSNNGTAQATKVSIICIGQK